MATLEELPEHWRLQLHSMSLSELQELCRNYDGSVPLAVLQHYRETFLWWAPWICTVDGELVDHDPPDRLPSVQRLAEASERGTFLL